MAGSIVSFDRFNGGAPLSVFARATLQTDIRPENAHALRTTVLVWLFACDAFLV